jgi:hypothetical protein
MSSRTGLGEIDSRLVDWTSLSVLQPDGMHGTGEKELKNRIVRLFSIRPFRRFRSFRAFGWLAG